MSITKLSDQELINSYLEGNESAFSVLLSRHKDKIYSSIYMFVKNDALAEDIFQDVFIKIIKTLKNGKYNHEGKFVQWACRIAYNMCVDHFRRSKRRPHVSVSEDFDVMDIQECTEKNGEEQMIMQQSHHRVNELLSYLPTEQKEVIVLRHYAELSFKEIAQLTDVSINTALGRMRYALINLRKVVEEKQITL